jgi:hypothetical protein
MSFNAVLAVDFNITVNLKLICYAPYLVFWCSVNPLENCAMCHDSGGYIPVFHRLESEANVHVICDGQTGALEFPCQYHFTNAPSITSDI